MTNLELPPTAPGFIEASRNFLIGGKSSQWLAKNQDKAFAAVDTALSQVARAQSLLESLLSDAEAGILPTRKIIGPNGPEEKEMETIDFVRNVSETLAVITGNLDKLVSTRMRVATGGANLMASALLTSQTIQNQVARAQPSNKSGRERKWGVQSLPEVVEI